MYPCPLTPRQQQVAGLLAFSFTAPQIAAVLHLAAKSAEHYTHQIYRRWGVTNRVAVLRMIWREELRVEAALSGKRPALPPTAGQWIEFYWFLMHSLANYGLAAKVQIQIAANMKNKSRGEQGPANPPSKLPDVVFISRGRRNGRAVSGSVVGQDRCHSKGRSNGSGRIPARGAE